MASRESTVAFIAEQLSAAGAVATRKMFGEYAIFCDGKMVALICDDRLFIKPTGAGRAHIGDVTEVPPYKGAKPCLLIDGDLWDDRDWLTTLVRVSAAELPHPDKSRRKRSSRQHTSSGSQPAATRRVTPADVTPLKALIDATGLFPSDMLDDMLAPSFGPEPDDRQVWLTDAEGGLVTVAYYAPERMTDGTWNLYLIAVHPDHQGQGRGSALLRQVEAALAAHGQRVLLVETSGLPEFGRTRAFYRGRGFEEEARIRDFYQAGEDKIIFRKALRPVSLAR